MQNIKNFKSVAPTQEQIEAYTQKYGQIPLFLKSEDGQDWYECQSLFAEDTVKIMYDENGTIWGVVSEPVPQRGNIYAVSLFFPENLSVAEISKDDFPAECCNDKTWKFDSGIITKIQEPQLLQSSRKTPRQLAIDAYMLQCVVDNGNATPEQVAELSELKLAIATSI